MDIYVLIEKEYFASSWCKNIISGINEEKKRKKIKIKYIETLEEIVEQANENTSIILIGTKTKWINENLNMIQKRNLNPILINNSQLDLISSPCSIVSSDIFGTVTNAISICKQNFNYSIALYGANPESVTDTLRKNAFISVGCNKNDIYFNNGSFKKCFYDFLPNLNKYNSVICVNDFAAISLINHLKAEDLYNENLSIISLSNSVLGQNFTPKITSYSINQEKFGAAAIFIHEALSKNKFSSSFNTLIKYDLILGETTKNINLNINNSNQNYTEKERNINIYEDDELSEMMLVEAFLKKLDDCDETIIKMIKDKQKQHSIADATFLSPSTLKYRIKNICKILKVSSINQAIEILEKYIVI